MDSTSNVEQGPVKLVTIGNEITMRRLLGGTEKEMMSTRRAKDIKKKIRESRRELKRPRLLPRRRTSLDLGEWGDLLEARSSFLKYLSDKLIIGCLSWSSTLRFFLFLVLNLRTIGQNPDKILSNCIHRQSRQNKPNRRRKIVTKQWHWAVSLSLLSKPIMVIPDKNNSLPENHHTHHKAHHSPNSPLNPASRNAQETCHKSKDSLADIEPRLDNHEAVIIHVVEGIEFVVVLVGGEERVVFATFEGLGAVQHEEGVE